MGQGKQANDDTSVPRIAWPTGLDVMPESEKAEVGTRLLYLYKETRTWMHRQVDSLRFDVGVVTRRHVSLDFTLPAVWAVKESEDRLLVPVALMVNGALSRLDVSEVGKKPAAVLTKRQNRFCSSLLLRAAASLLLPENIHEHVYCRIDAAFGSSPDTELDAGSMRSYLEDTLREKTQESQDFLAIWEELSQNFLFIISVDATTLGQRCIVKFSYDQQNRHSNNGESYPGGKGTYRTKVGHGLQHLSKVESQHFEIRVPEGLMIENPIVKTSEKVYAPSSTAEHVAHIPIVTKTTTTLGVCTFTVRPASQGIVHFARIAIPSVAAALLAATLTRFLHWPFIAQSIPPIPTSPAIPIILIGPALLLSWLSKSREHDLVAAAMEPLRAMMFLTATGLIILAATVALPLVPLLKDIGWISSTVLALLSLVWMILYFINLPIPRFLRKLYLN